MSSTDEIRKSLLAKRPKVMLSRESAFSTGSTLLNLACTDRAGLGFMKGYYYYIVGDSTSGKTWFTLSCFAEAAQNENFDEYRFIYDDIESGALMDMGYYFGNKAAQRIEPPAVTKSGKAVHSDTVESFYFHITDLLKRGERFIYVLDSQDALTSKSWRKKFEEQKDSVRKNKSVAGSYGDGKAKYHSEHLRFVISELYRTGSILIITGQTRDNLGFGFEQKTRAGGKSLRFYASIEIWTSVAGQIKKNIRGRDRSVGVKCQAAVKKNRVTGKTGKDRSVVIPIYHDLGIDDIGSCVDYLIEENHWPKTKGGYQAHELELCASRSAIIRHVEKNNMENRLRKIVGGVWKAIEEECKPRRKKRYQ